MPATRILPLPNIAYSQQEQGVDLPRGVWISKLLIRITGTMTIAAGAASGTVLSESVQRLIRSLRVTWDGVEVVDSLSGRDLVALARRGTNKVLVNTTIASGDVQAGTAFAITFPIYFARPWLVNAFNTAFPPVKVESELRMYVAFETAAANAGSSAGTGAFLTGNDRTCTFPTGPTIEVFAEVSNSGAQPFALPFYQKFTAPPWAAATTDLSFDFPRNRAFDLMLIATDQGVNFEPQDAINTVTLESASQMHIRAESLAMLRQLEYLAFPGVPAAETGKLGVLMANGGKIADGGFNPGAYAGTRMTLDVAAPTAGSGRAQVILAQLVSAKGYTVL